MPSKIDHHRFALFFGHLHAFFKIMVTINSQWTCNPFCIKYAVMKCGASPLNNFKLIPKIQGSHRSLLPMPLSPVRSSMVLILLFSF